MKKKACRTRNTLRLTAEILIIIMLTLAGFNILTGILWNTPSKDVVFHPSGSNAYFYTNQSLNLDNISISSTIFTVNSTGFNISSSNRVNITIMDLNDNPNVGENAVSFYADCSSGTVWFNLSGYTNNVRYNISKDSVFVETVTVADGVLSFSNSVWSEHLFDILLYTTNTPPAISNPFPANNSVNVPISGSPINAYIIDSDGDSMNTSVWSNYTGSWVQYAGWELSSPQEDYEKFMLDVDSDGDWDFTDEINYALNDGWQTNGTRGFLGNMTVTDDWGMTSIYTKYWWSVNVTDGTNWTNATYNFTTREQYNVSPPSSFSATTYNKTQINLTWVKGSNASHTYIERNTSENWSRGEGTEICNDTGTSNESGGLTPDTTYYYQAWGWNETDGVWSTTNVSANATTNGLPTLSSESPTNSSTGINLNPTLSVIANESESELMNLSFWTNASGSWEQLGDYHEGYNGTYNDTNATNMNSLTTTYWWSVNCSVSIYWTNETYHFTTAPYFDIDIEDNDEFIAENYVYSGSGTEGDPYIIENLTIRYCNISGQAQGDPIVKYFKIQNCTVEEQIHIGDYIDDGRAWIDSISSNNTNNTVIWVENWVDDALITNCTFENHTIFLATATPAVVYVFPSSHGTIVRNCSFMGNGTTAGSSPTAWRVRGFMSTSSNTDVIVENSEFYNQYVGVAASIGMIIRNCTFDNSEVANSDECIVVGVDGVLIENCNFTGNNTNDLGIELSPSGEISTTIKDCVFDGVYDGIFLYRQIGGGNNNGALIENCAINNSDHIGLSILAATGCTLRNISITNCSGMGMEIRGIWSAPINNNTLYNLTITDNDEGIWFEDNPVIVDNLFYNNYFAANTVHLYSDGTDLVFLNQIWNVSKTLGTNIIDGLYLGGNYWDDYAGYDSDGDGIGDTDIPFMGLDYLPLIDTVYPLVVTNSSTGVMETNVTLHGYLFNDGGENCTVWFEYGTTESYGNDTRYNLSYNFINSTTTPDTSRTPNLQFHSDYWIQNNSIASDTSTEHFLNTTGLWDNISAIFRVYNGVITSWLSARYGSGLPNDLADITSDGIYYFYMSNDTAPFILGWDTTINRTSGYSLTRDLYIRPGTLYHYRAGANNSQNTTYGSDVVFLSRPKSPQRYVDYILGEVRYLNVTNAYSPDTLNLSWTKGMGANNTYIERNIDSSWSRGEGTLVYNNTATYYNDTGLTMNTLYYYQAWGFTNWTDDGTTYWQYSSDYASNSNTTANVDPPYNGSSSYDTTNFRVNLTWTRGNNSDREIVVQNNNSYPISPTDGWIRQNDTNTYFNTSIISNGYFTVWSYNDTAQFYSSVGLNIPWGALELNVFDENTPWIPIENYTIFITNTAGTETYYEIDVTNPKIISFESIPFGINTIIQINHPDYEQHTLYVDLYVNTYYNYTFYLPSIEAPPGGGGEQGGGGDCITRPYLDSITVPDPNVDVTINLTYTLENIIEVHIFNNSFFGDYGGWVPVPSDKFTYNTTAVTINNSFLDINTTIARVNYYYEDCDTYTPPALYYIRVVESYQTEYLISDRAVENAKVTFQRYINTTDLYEDISILLTDANGYVDLYLMPGVIYKIIITKDGYLTKSSNYQPAPPNQYGQTVEKVFRIEQTVPDATEPSDIRDDVFKNINWTLEPMNVQHHSLFTIWFNITSSDCKLEWYRMIVWYYNNSNSTWIQLYNQNQTNACGGQLNYSIPNITGRYAIECFYKKTNFTEYECFQQGSLIMFFSFLKAGFEEFPDFAYFIVLIVIMIVVMGFFYWFFATGVITGYIGLIIFAIGLLMKPLEIVISVDSATGSNRTISGWLIFAITFIMYTVGLYLWSKI